MPPVVLSTSLACKGEPELDFFRRSTPMLICSTSLSYESELEVD
jgi:hypothetical protein